MDISSNLTLEDCIGNSLKASRMYRNKFFTTVNFPDEEKYYKKVMVQLEVPEELLKSLTVLSINKRRKTPLFQGTNVAQKLEIPSWVGFLGRKKMPEPESLNVSRSQHVQVLVELETRSESEKNSIRIAASE